MKLTELDKNFQTLIPDEQGFVYRDVLSGTFALEGLPWHTSNKETYYRFPERLTEKEVNRGALELAHNTSGACIRFKTNSTEIILKAELAWDLGLKHNVGRRGFDSYIRHPDGSLTFHRLVRPGPQDDSVIGSCAQNPSGVMREYWINLPPYGGVTKIEIGLKAEAQLEAPPPHAIPKPILFYGSSITQGGCASRPGSTYTSMLCRTLDAEQINLGFSGCGKGEPAVAEAIAELDLAAFVLDYDHNAPTVEHLEATHSNFFKIIRAKHPELPIIIISRCDFYASEESILQRREIIRKTYTDALNAGDKNVYFIDGEILWGTEMRDACTWDGCHPNDLGFYRMYERILPVLKQVLSIK